jgi:hypothetical protein
MEKHITQSNTKTEQRINEAICKLASRSSAMRRLVLFFILLAEL